MEKETKIVDLSNHWYPEALKTLVQMKGCTFEQLVKQVILRSFDQIKTEAEKNQVCKRKAVGAAILEISLEKELITHYMAINGPSGPNNECSNIVGACGCAHAESRVIMDYLKRRKRNGRVKTILLSTYSPCVPCANLTIDSEVIDVFAYEIWTPHWNKHPYFADAIIQHSNLLYWTKQLIEEDIEMNLIKNWLLKN